jgi:hypothetical protein
MIEMSCVRITHSRVLWFEHLLEKQDIKAVANNWTSLLHFYTQLFYLLWNEKLEMGHQVCYVSGLGQDSSGRDGRRRLLYWRSYIERLYTQPRWVSRRRSVMWEMQFTCTQGLRCRADIMCSSNKTISTCMLPGIFKNHSNVLYMITFS